MEKMEDYGYGDDREADMASPSDAKEFRRTATNLNSRPTNFPRSRRDFIDNYLTFVNRDLVVCKLFYFFFFGAFGSLFPLLAIYFKQLGMNASQGGMLIGFRPFIEFLSAPFWGGVADKWKRAKELLLFSLICWIVFTLAIAFVHPPAHKCLYTNRTHTVLENPRGRRDTSYLRGTHQPVISHLEVPYRYARSAHDDHEPEQLVMLLPQSAKRGTGESPHRLDHNKIANANQSDVKGLVHSPYSTVVYREDEVKHVFFILLLLVVIGEFFAAPAITFADAVTLACLGEDMDNYGRQRMFGSLGWGLSMFFAGLALDHSTSFPEHPCGTQHAAEKNYTVCFAIFCVLMSAAFIAALQFRFEHMGHGKEIQLSEITERVKDKVKQTITGRKKIDRERLVEEDDDDDGVFKPELGSTAYNQNKFRESNSPGENQYGKLNGNQELNIKLNNRNDMVSDALKAPQGNSQYEYQDGHFMGKWFTVIKLLATYKYLSVLFIAWFMGFGIGIIFTFLFWHLQDLGGSPTLFGVASVINHISELLAYFMSAKLIAKFGHIKVLYAGLLGNVVRFMYISWLHNPQWVLPFEFVQGLTHAAVWAACCSYITQAIPKELRSSAQGILQGLHHGLGRGCGAVFGGVLVYNYGSVITFRVYGVTCIFVLAIYMGTNYYLERRGYFSHVSEKISHEILEEASILAPHGVPSGASALARDLSSNRLSDYDQGNNQGYGATHYEGINTLPTTMPKRDNAGSYNNEINYNGNFADWSSPSTGGDRLFMQEPPRMPTQMYQQQPNNTMDQMYGP
ncbi:major facilitator superfamily domain-containing protein 6 [Patella vulgata]|uniref:major facilitator superfamily domain-containing protein 6 n=1 Tax=Patella vulgata TaxID=6465 RepID=UPI0021801149|nr:major facilitator superfamily domain-containing protein 6 [Patella vulgata]